MSKDTPVSRGEGRVWTNEMSRAQRSYDNGVRFFDKNTDRVGSIYVRQPNIMSGWLDCRQARMIGKK